MIINVQRDGLLSACQLVSQAVSSNSPKAILQNIKAIADGERLTLIGTDLEVGIRYELAGVTVEEPGEAILPAKRLVAILKESSEDTLKLDADGMRCLVSSFSSEYEMPSEDPAAFPDVAAFGESKYSELTAGVLRTMIRLTAFAAAKADTKYAITGIMCEVDDKKFRMVGTDTRRLAMATGATTLATATDSKGHLVPVKAMELLGRTLADDGELVKVCLRANDVLFQTELATITSRLIEGRFPPYRDIIPKKATIKIPLSVDAFMSAVKKSAIMAEADSKRVTFAFARGKLTLTAQGSLSGRSKVEMVIDYSGEPISIIFDPQYVIEMLRVLDSASSVVIEMSDPMKPAIFRAGEDYLYLVMPLS